MKKKLVKKIENRLMILEGFTMASLLSIFIFYYIRWSLMIVVSSVASVALIWFCFLLDNIREEIIKYH